MRSDEMVISTLRLCPAATVKLVGDTVMELPAGALAYALGTKAAGTLNVEFYTDVEETLPAPVVLEPLLEIAPATASPARSPRDGRR